MSNLTSEVQLTRRLQKIRKDVLSAFPDTWLDPLLSGPKAVCRVPAGCPDIEALLKAVKARVAETFDEYEIKEKRSVRRLSR